jgi:hypothetical protein
MAEKKLLKIHKNFRIVALAEPPNSTGIMLNLLVYYIILKMKAEIQEKLQVTGFHPKFFPCSFITPSVQ